MTTIERVVEDVVSNTDRVMEHWRSHIEREPWLSLPEDARLDHLPELLEALMKTLLGQDDPGPTRERAVRTALRHGRDRRNDGFEDGLLHREHHLLRSAVWEVIRDRHGTDPVCFNAIARFDVALTHATTAALHGYHLEKGDVEASEEEVVARLIQEEPWPP